MIFVIDDDATMAECVGRATQREYRRFSNGVEAMAAIAEGAMPEMVFLDVLLDGPDGFTFLDELVSYQDTAQIPVVLVSALDFAGKDLEEYGVVGVLNKETMYPEEVLQYVKRYGKDLDDGGRE